MESLKKLEEICQPDVRQKKFVRLEASGTFRHNTLEDFHRAADGIRLHDGVPENIRSLFETARNLIVYSWFYYPFKVTVEVTARSPGNIVAAKQGCSYPQNSPRRRQRKRFGRFAMQEDWTKPEWWPAECRAR